ncbi:MAG: hypothetical protein IJV27_11415, partial [Prevotella sp.]|nr:hypothetical protein [Prevotella sp.]
AGQTEEPDMSSSPFVPSADFFKRTSPKQKGIISEEDSILSELHPETIENRKGTVEKQVKTFICQAESEVETYNENVKQQNDNDMANDLQVRIKGYPMKDRFRDIAKEIKLPLFYIKVKSNDVFNIKEAFIKLEKIHLLNGFDLKKQNSEIDYLKAEIEAREIDLEEWESEDEYRVVPRRMENQQLEYYRQFFVSLPMDRKQNQLVDILYRQLKNMDTISVSDLKYYIRLTLANLDNEALTTIYNNIPSATTKLRKKIKKLLEQYSEEKFYDLLDTNDIVLGEPFRLKEIIYPHTTSLVLTKSLYTGEDRMNGLEQEVADKIAGLSNVTFWHRNLERGSGFFLNAYIYHYPDFIVRLESGVIALIETKGEDRDNSDSRAKIKLGATWAAKAGEQFRYYMVFKGDKKLEDAISVDTLVEKLSKL